MALFNHFGKDFICPYGLSHYPKSFETSTNFEFYMQPEVAISEFTETISASLKYMEKNREILDTKSITAERPGVIHGHLKITS